MRFMALLRKELRESLPWIVLAVITLLVLGGFAIRMQARYDLNRWRFDAFEPGKVVDDPYELLNRSMLNDASLLLLYVSAGLGLILAGRHFGLPFLTRTWPFLLHRSSTRMAILGAKLLAAAIAQVVCIGLIWLLLFKYASSPGLVTIPPPTRAAVDGFFFILFGLLVYWGTALSALSTSRWYTTRVFGLAFATVVVLAVASSSSRPWGLVTIFIAALILLSQIVHTFQTREF